MVTLTAAQLKRAHVIKLRIESLESKLQKIFGGGTPSYTGAKRGRKPKRKMSAAAKAKISAAAKKRWAKAKAAGKSRL
jgi:hypothetical protein